MRSSVRVFLVAAMALGALGLAVAPSGAGIPPTNSVTVVKEVTGDVPAGTTFTVEVTCASILGTGAAVSEPVDITFDADGVPTGDATVNVFGGTQCTIQETDDGGASSTTYACDMEHSNTDQTEPYLGNCDSDTEVTFGDVIGDAATVTVTNDFPTTPTTTTTTTPAEPVTPAAQAVQARPVFTG